MARKPAALARLETHTVALAHAKAQTKFYRSMSFLSLLWFATAAIQWHELGLVDLIVLLLASSFGLVGFVPAVFLYQWKHWADEHRKLVVRSPFVFEAAEEAREALADKQIAAHEDRLTLQIEAASQCAKTTSTESVTSMRDKITMKQARAAKAKLIQVLGLETPPPFPEWFRGIGIGMHPLEDCICVQLNVQSEKIPVELKIPTSIEGVPVILQNVGEICAL